MNSILRNYSLSTGSCEYGWCKKKLREYGDLIFANARGACVKPKQSTILFAR
jgi:hypothetical protein